jgi:hypothetical protein
VPASPRSLVSALALALAAGCASPPPATPGAPPSNGMPTPMSPEMPTKSDDSGPKEQPEAPLERARSAPEGCGMAIGDVAMYQGVKTLLVHDGEEVRHHAVDVVQRREAMVRVFLKTTSSFIPGMVQASLTLSGRGGKTTLVAAQKIAGPSADGDLDSTLNFDVSADLIDDKTSFAIQFSAPSACGSLRFPEEKQASMGARQVGKLKIKLVPIRFGADGSDRMPDVGPDQLARIRDRVQAMYPVEKVELSLREPVRTSIAVSSAPETWDHLLDSMRDLRAADKPDDDVYYFGLIAPADSLLAYCPDQCYLGLSFRTDKAASKYQAGVGVGFSGEVAATTLAHELGHMVGRKHAPCHVSTFIDPQYPQPEGKTGTWGWDLTNHKLYAPDSTDLMGYCSPSWISDYTYRAILDRVIEVDGSGKGASAQSLSPAGRMLMVSGGQARWGLDASDAGEGTMETATVRDEAGLVVATVEVRRLELGEGDRWSVLVPQAQPGWSTIEVAGARPVRFDEPTAASAFER